MSEPLDVLRLRLTAWYAGTFATILALLGVGLFITIRNTPSHELDASLRDATAALSRAARLRETQVMGGTGQVQDAVDELRIPDRTLYLLDVAGATIRPDSAPLWVRDAARQLHHVDDSVTHRLGSIELSHPLDGGRTLRLHAEEFLLPSRNRMIAVAVADNAEVQVQYTSLIAAFGAAAAFALVLVLIGGRIVASKSMRPIERSMDHMRRFMADAAHELRTPITVLRSRAEVALSGTPSEVAYAAALQAIHGEAERLGRIVEDLLMLARADAGERPIAFHRVFLDDVTLDAADAAQALAQSKGVFIDIEEFQEAPVQGDAPLLRQLIMIILDNAVKYTPPAGRVRVRVCSHADRPTVVVQDTGRGIPDDQLPHVFERFYRGDPSRHRGDAGIDARGAGLGLSIALWIANAHRANIAITSEPNRGTTVSVDFPPAPPPTDS
ncbi:MAG TPA: HAMP domain-containing sensor histidine kinase [Gemmatimonadaceae bacterium]|nr:HAMP domain-containing sensor histidine kinase [Gemmatimonadaceae bacterium]